MTDSAFRIVLVALIIGVNAFFAGAEVALVSVRASRLRQMAAEGQAGAQAALSILANPGRLLSVTQVGVTLASLGLGWAGEGTAYDLLISAFQPAVTPATEKWIHGGAFVLAFLIISYCHVVIGEVVPKNLSIDRADRLAVLVAPALLVFYRISLPFVVVIERSSAAVSRMLGLHGGERGGGHSTEELRFIVSTSRGMGFLPEEEEEMIHRVLDLNRLAVREIMVPRNDVVSISVDATLDEVLHTMIEQQHSRLPVWEGEPEKIIGLLHYKDLLPAWQERRMAMRSGRPSRPFQIRRLLRKHVVAPESKPVAQMLEEFKHGRSHMAMVVNEFGTIVGIVTVEDVLEEIVGNIADEYDVEHELPPAEADEAEVDGATRIRDLQTDYGIELPTGAGFETLAGFLLYQLGSIPRPGQSLDYGGRRYTVLEMDRNRIARVRIEKIAEQPRQSETLASS